MQPSQKEKRPLSPHLQIYKIQITSLLSILHRVTGVILYGGALIWTAWLLALAYGPQCYEAVQKIILHPLGLIVLVGWSFSFFYHLCNGIRHLMWDLGIGYELRAVRLTGWIVVFSSFALTGVSWAFGIFFNRM